MGVAALLNLGFLSLAVLALLDVPILLHGTFAFALGLLALGSIGAFFTAFLSTMKWVPYCEQRSAWERFKMCVERTSRLEIIVRTLIGLTLGGGAFLFGRLTGAC